MQNFVRIFCAAFLCVLASVSGAQEKKAIIHKVKDLTAQTLGIVTVMNKTAIAGSMSEMRIVTSLGHIVFIDADNNAAGISVGEEVSLIEYDTTEWVRVKEICPSRTSYRFLCTEVTRMVQPEVYPADTDARSLVLDMIASRSEQPLGAYLSSVCSLGRVSRCSLDFKTVRIVVEGPYNAMASPDVTKGNFVLVTLKMKNGETELRLCPEHKDVCGKATKHKL